MKKGIIDGEQSMILLSAPLAYTLLNTEEKEKICNGCGAKGGIPIPDYLLGLDISEACHIHDYRYYEGATWEDKEFADEEFRLNLFTIIDSEEYFDEFDEIRKIEAEIYVKAVKIWGDDAFVAEKNIRPREIK